PETVRDRETAVTGLRGRLASAVERRSRDGPTGVLLSGGIDSSAVAGVAAELSAGDGAGPRAYSAVFPLHPRADESRLIDSLVTSLRLEGVRIEVEGGSPLGGSLDYLAEYQLPPSSPNLFFWIPLLRRARADGVTALMDGEGGDEVMGTPYYLLGDRVRRGRLADAVGLARRFPGAGENLPLRSVLSVLRDYGLRGALRAGEPRGFRPPPAWLAPSMQSAYLDSEDPWEWARAPGPRWWAQLVRALTSSGGSVLGRDQVRHRSTLVGLEASHPLLDLDLVEYVFSLDPALAFDRHLSRPLLRAAVEGLIPDAVRLRPWKTNLDTVFHSGLETDRAAIERLLGDSRAEVRAYVDPAGVKHELLDAPSAGFASGKQARGIYVWRLATAECWLRAQDDPDAPRRALEDSQPARYAIRPQ
ncbi:MAG: asparagine synthase-related protein, partial [Solirubrobacterales bacterium]